MANWSDPRATASPQPGTLGREGVAYDAGLRSYMLSVYNYMTSGVLLTGIIALLFAQSAAAPAILFGPGILKYVIMFSPLLFVLVLNFGIERLSTGAAQALFWAFAGVMGLSMASIFFVFSGQSIATTFFATAASFASLSLWGYTTKKDLSGLGVFLIMGLFGILIALVINIFVQSTAFQLAISVIGVLVFAGLTAYDTQRVKSLYFHVQGSDLVGKTAIMGALSLYLDFVNMFTFLLNLMGNRD
ncbi:MAG TPA: Bax inhibitor-1/YccA family protein [Allosphingosinicella sp.]